MNRRVGFLFGVILLVCISSLGMGGSIASADQIAGSPSNVELYLLEQLTQDGEAAFLVMFNQTADLSAAEGMDRAGQGEYVYQALIEQAQRSQGAAIAFLKEIGLIYRSFFASNTLYVFEGDMEAVIALANLPEVNRIIAARSYDIAGAVPVDAPYNPMELLASGSQFSVPAGSPEEMSWAVIDTQADDFWATYGFAGEGILVANIDTGVQWDHPALIESYKCQLNPGDPACWFDPSGICSEPCDGNGHGTATMGPITGENELIVPHQVGMAPEAQWIACKGCSDGGMCTDNDLLACADWVLAPGGNPANRPHLVSNSWGGSGCSSWFDTALNAWMAAGIASTFSPGGSGPECGTIGSPADHQQVFATTAHDVSRNISSFAARGPSCYGHDPFTKPNMSGPGVNLLVPVPINDWATYSGTSISNGYGAGALALLMSCAPQLIGDPYAVYDALQDGADTPPVGGCGAPPDGEGNYTYGYGYINMLSVGLLYCGASGWLEGIVTDQESGSPLEGAVITATLTSNPLMEYSTFTNAGGYYNMTLLIGPYDLEAEYPDFEPGYGSVEILTDTLSNQDFALVPESIAMGGIDGTVTDQRTGIALQGAVVTATLVSDPLTWITITTDETGYYTLTLEVGQYDLVVTYIDYEPGTATVDVLIDEVIHQDFILWDGVWYSSLPIVLKN